jgi:hypothetical protein
VLKVQHFCVTPLKWSWLAWVASFTQPIIYNVSVFKYVISRWRFRARRVSVRPPYCLALIFHSCFTDIRSTTANYKMYCEWAMVKLISFLVTEPKVSTLLAPRSWGSSSSSSTLTIYPISRVSSHVHLDIQSGRVPSGFPTKILMYSMSTLC